VSEERRVDGSEMLSRGVEISIARGVAQKKDGEGL